jgi:hypothetical protein
MGPRWRSLNGLCCSGDNCYYQLVRELMAERGKKTDKIRTAPRGILYRVIGGWKGVCRRESEFRVQNVFELGGWTEVTELVSQ